MKRGKGFFNLIVFAILVFSFNLVLSYEYDASNISIDPIQIIGEPISGNFVLSLAEAPVNLIFSSEFGNITLKELLANDGKSLGCERFDCASIYKAKDEGVSSLSFNANRLGKVYGLLYLGESISANSLSMKVFASFSESAVVPFSIGIGNDFLWNFNSVSENINNSRQFSQGCFNSGSPLTDGEIDTKGYCEEVNLTDSPAYYLGANVSGSGSKQLIFSLNKDGSEIKNCVINLESASYSSPVGCMVLMSETQSEGTYEVCVKGNEDNAVIYNLKKEILSPNCGRYSSGAKLADYSLFVKVPYYSALSGEVNLGTGFESSALDSINSYLTSVYGNNCSAGCVVPIIFYGNNPVNVSDLNSAYSSSTGPIRSNKFYSLTEDVYKTDFIGIISLKSFNWIINKYGNLTLKIDLIANESVKNLLSKSFFVEPVPYANSVYPLNPPAGIDVYFYANIDGNFSKIIWNFGDGSSSVETNTSYVKHKYQNVSSTFNLSVNVFGKNSSITKYFSLFATSPVEYVNESISFKRSLFNSLSVQIENLPSAIKDFVKQKLNISSLQLELNQIEIDRAKASSSEDFLNIVTRIDSLDIPYSFSEYETRTGPISSFSSEIDPSIIQKIKPGNYSNLEKYSAPIFSWQITNISSSLTKKKFQVVKKNNERENFLVYYEVNLKSSFNDDSYFIVRKPLSTLHFSSGVSANDIGGNNTYIVISPLQETKFTFYSEGGNDIFMFASPSLSSLQIADDISVCNVNEVCQKDIGENSKNCPQDCKSVLPTTFAIMGVLLFVLIIYTFLQIWYVRKYEQYLFKDRTFVFNLIAFINNSKLNGVTSNAVYSMLSAKGWTSEQIDYAMKKSEGKNTGMYELLPVQKIVAYYEMKKAEKVKSIKISVPSKNNFSPRFQPINTPRSFSGNQQREAEKHKEYKRL